MKEGLWVNISENAQELIHRMLDVNPNTRITIDEALEHPWIRVRVKTLLVIFISYYVCYGNRGNMVENPDSIVLSLISHLSYLPGCILSG